MMPTGTSASVMGHLITTMADMRFPRANFWSPEKYWELAAKMLCFTAQGMGIFCPLASLFKVTGRRLP